MTEIELGKKYAILFKGRVTEVIVTAHKRADEDVLWSQSEREAVLLKLPSGRKISRSPKALRELEAQLNIEDLLHKQEE